MKTNSAILLEELAAITRTNIEAAGGFLNLDEQQLNFRPSTYSWSILECLEHLNRYSAFYLPEISRHLNKKTAVSTTFKSGFWGNYLVSMVIPENGGKKMKTFTKMNPMGSNPDKSVIGQFLKTQNELLGLIDAAGSGNLNRAGVAVTFTKLVRLKTGDALRFMAYHNQRHMMQAQRIRF